MFNEIELKRKYQTVQMIAVALIMGVVTVAGIFYYLIKQQSGPIHSMTSLMSMVVMLVSVINLAMSFIIKNQILQRKGNPVEQLMSAFFVSMALCEGSVLFGLVIAFVFKNILGLMLPAVVALIGFSLHFPQYDQWENYVKNHQGV